MWFHKGKVPNRMRIPIDKCGSEEATLQKLEVNILRVWTENMDRHNYDVGAMNRRKIAKGSAQVEQLATSHI